MVEMGYIMLFLTHCIGPIGVATTFGDWGIEDDDVTSDSSSRGETWIRMYRLDWMVLTSILYHSWTLTWLHVIDGVACCHARGRHRWRMASYERGCLSEFVCWVKLAREADRGIYNIIPLGR